MNAALEPLKEAMKGDDTDAIQSAMDKLQEEVMAMGQSMYGQPGAEGAAGPGGPGAGGPGAGAGAGAGPKPDDDVIDADFSENKK